MAAVVAACLHGRQWHRPAHSPVLHRLLSSNRQRYERNSIDGGWALLESWAQWDEWQSEAGALIAAWHIALGSSFVSQRLARPLRRRASAQQTADAGQCMEKAGCSGVLTDAEELVKKGKAAAEAVAAQPT